MYNVSSQFHTKIKEGAAQDLLITFGDAYVMASQNDIESSGATFNEFFNINGEVNIGEAPSSTFSVSLMNLDGHLSNYHFGIGRPFIGVQTGTFTSARARNLNAYSEVTIGTTAYYFRGSDSGLTINNTSRSTSPVHIIWAEGDIVLVVTDANIEEYQFDTSTSTWNKSTKEANDFILSKPNGGYSFIDNILRIYKPVGLSEIWEYCPLGVFRFEEPTKRQTPIINLTAYDKMTLFDKDVSEFINGNWIYPITLEGLFRSLCQYVGLAEGEYEMGDFTNSNMSFTAFPTMSPSLTCRSILALIAEAAGAVAKFDRDGVLRFKWYGQTPTITETSDNIAMNSIEMAEFATPPIDRLMAKLADGTVHYEGEGQNTYTILANSFVGSDSARFAPIYEKLESVGAYSPVSLKVLRADPSVEAGDAVKIYNDAVIPLMQQELRWASTGSSVYSASGNAERSIPQSLDRFDYAVIYNSQAVENVRFGLTQDIGGITATVTNAKQIAQNAADAAEFFGSAFSDYRNNSASAIETAQNLTSHVRFGILGTDSNGNPVTGVGIGDEVTSNSGEIVRRNITTVTADGLRVYSGITGTLVAEFTNKDVLVNGDLNIEGMWKWFVEPDGSLAHKYIGGS